MPFAPDAAYETEEPAAAATFEDTSGPVTTGPDPQRDGQRRSSAAAFGAPALAPSAAVADRQCKAAPWERTRPRDRAAARRRPRAPGRAGIRTDTMIVFTMDVKTKHAALFSVPRNMWGVPLPPAAAARFGDTYDNLLNSLYPFALAPPRGVPAAAATRARPR